MPNNPISPALPADLPTNWVYGQTIGPNGTDVGLTLQHGYNYLMQAVNAAQASCNALGQAIAALTAASVGADPSGTASSAVASHNTSGTAHQDIRTEITNLDSNLGLQIYQHVTNYSNPHTVTAAQVGAYTKAQVDDLLEYMPKIATGSYVGDGTYGESHKTQVSVPFVPKMLIVNGVWGVPNDVKGSCTGVLVPGENTVPIDYSSNTRSVSAEVVGTTFRFWSSATFNSDNSSLNGSQQANMDGQMYTWIALG